MRRSEPKQYAIKRARLSWSKDGLSNTVLYPEESSHCYVSFDTKLVQAVGKTLPRGVSAKDPAFLYVVMDKQRQVWVVYAQYVESAGSTQNGYAMWESATRPAWLKETGKPRKTHDNRKSTQSESTSTGTGSAAPDPASATQRGTHHGNTD